MDNAYLFFRDVLIRSVMEAKLARIAQGKPVVSNDPIVANQIAAVLTFTAYQLPPVNRQGQAVWEG